MGRRYLKVTIKDKRRKNRNLVQHCGYIHNTTTLVVFDVKFSLDVSVENAMVKGEGYWSARDTVCAHWERLVLGKHNTSK